MAESLSPIAKKVDEVKESTQELRDVIKKLQPETPQLAIENTPVRPPIENNEGVIYDVELENTIKNMRDNTGFFKTHEDPQSGWMLNDQPIKMLRGTEVEINGNKYNIAPGLQKVFTDKSYDTAESMNDMEKIVFRYILTKNWLL